MLLRAAKEDDRARVLALLEATALPIEGVAEHFDSFIVAASGTVVVGAAGLELAWRRRALAIGRHRAGRAEEWLGLAACTEGS